MYQPNDIFNALGISSDVASNQGLIIRDFHVDSRKVLHPESTLFFCLTGHRTDGHDYIEELYQKGVRGFVISRKVAPLPDAVFFQSGDVLTALQKMAGFHRQKMKAKIIAITGSNGKTTVKEWLSDLLSIQYQVHKSPGSYNSQIGVPLSILSIQPKHEYAVIEVGISKPGEMQKLQELVQPEYGLLTMIGSAHDAGFEDREQKLKEKSLLFKDAIMWMSRSSFAKYQTDNHVAPGPSDVETAIATQHNDQASQENLHLLLSFIRHLFPDLWSMIHDRHMVLPAIEMRTDLKSGIRNNTIICDYYNADLESLQNTLQWSFNLDINQPKTLILSDMPGLRHEIETNTQLAEIIRQFALTRLIYVGENPPSFKGNSHAFLTTDDLISSGVLDSLRDQTIIIKGSRAHRFERVEHLLVQPIVGTSLTLDMEALHHNWITLQKLLGEGVQKLVMIKAAAYGSGLVDIARFFQEHKADYIGVAYANEGIALRENGIDMPILMLNGHPQVVDLMVSHRLEPVIHSIDQLRQYGHRLPETISFDCHLNLNTGMNRLGIYGDEISKVIELLDDFPQLRIKSIMSHLAASEKPGAKNFTLRQIRDLRAWSNDISRALQVKIPLHILNSSGVIHYPEAQLDMVRFGIALYGCIEEAPRLDLQPVHHLHTRVIQIRKVAAGTNIGYGADCRVTKASTIATIPLGYADGIPTSMGQGKLKVMIKGQQAHSVGRICMDMCMIDITNLEDIIEGDEVEIFGDNLTLLDFSRAAGTIPYEILVRIGQRVERVFRHR